VSQSLHASTRRSTASRISLSFGGLTSFYERTNGAYSPVIRKRGIRQHLHDLFHHHRYHHHRYHHHRYHHHLVDKVKSVIKKVVTKVEGKVHSVVTKVESKVLHAIDKVWHKVSDLTSGDMDFDFDIRISKNLEGKERVQPLQSLQGMGVLPTFTFINTGFDIDAIFFIEMEFSVLNRNAFDLLLGDDEKSKLSSFISSDMVQISMGMEANQDVSLPHRSDIQILTVCSSRSACRLNYTYPKTLSTFAHCISGPRPVCLAAR
jgi:hypothetical protein